jgi:transcriptional regulator with XRE-family HTH domain
VVAEEMRVLFARRLITPAKVARALGWTDNYISRRLTGKVPFDVNDLAALAELLGVPIMTFFVPLEESPRDLTHATLRSLAGGTTKPKYSTPVRPEISEMSFSAPSGPVRTQAA